MEQPRLVSLRAMAEQPEGRCPEFIEGRIEAERSHLRAPMAEIASSLRSQ